MIKPITVFCPPAQITVGGAARLYVNKAYADAVARVGGVLVTVNSHDEGIWSHMIETVADAVLFQGGCDIHPFLYGEKPVVDVSHCDPLRDRLEAEMMLLCIEKKIPTLAICRGMQMLNVVCGGTLHQHLPDDLINTHYPQVTVRYNLVHSVKIEEGNRLYHALGRCRLLPVNSMHHQGIKTLGEKLTVLARCHDGLVESVELTDHPYCVGVQWHPEELLGGSRTKNLFKSFIQQLRSVLKRLK